MLVNKPLVCSALLSLMCTAPLQAEVEFYIDDADGWRSAIGEPLTEIDWYPHWLPPGDIPQSDWIPVDYYLGLGIQTGLVDPAYPDVIEPRITFDLAYDDPTTPAFYVAASSSPGDPRKAHLWFSEPISGFQVSVLANGPYEYTYFRAFYYLDGTLVGESFGFPGSAQSSVGILADFVFDHAQVVPVIGRLEFPTIGVDPDCPDINGDGSVGVDEVLAVIAMWNSADPDTDVNNDGIVNTDDLLFILSAWGVCV